MKIANFSKIRAKNFLIKTKDHADLGKSDHAFQTGSLVFIFNIHTLKNIIIRQTALMKTLEV